MKDKRKHIYLSDKKLIEKLERIKDIEDLTYDELLSKYVNLPEEDETAHKKYLELKEMMGRSYQNPKLEYLMEYLWVYLIRSAHGDLDIEKILQHLDAALENKIYKKR